MLLAICYLTAKVYELVYQLHALLDLLTIYLYMFIVVAIKSANVHEFAKKSLRTTSIKGILYQDRDWSGYNKKY